jgi:photosystem II stability/assembly factor-like uncharacterized protein
MRFSRGRLAALLVTTLLLLTVDLHTVSSLPTSLPTAGELSEVMLRNLRWRSVGPAHPSGRVTDIAVPKGQPFTIYCATATGGVWKTTNNGTTWQPVFDREGSGSIGAMAVSESDPNVVWVGTGEANASSYSSWGDGVYKSTDAGKTWTHTGLRNTHHIGRIVIDPRTPDVVYVASVGHLWGPSAERGLFKTTDGGKTWLKTLYVSDDVGVVDVVMDPSDNKTLYAAAYGRRADRFDDFDSMGISVLQGSGIYKTTDAGGTWQRSSAGLPPDRLGRIGIAVSPTRPNILYANVERAPFNVKLSGPDVERIRQLLDSDADPGPAEIQRIRGIVDDRTPQGEAGTAVVVGLSRTQQIQLRTLLNQGDLDTGGGVFRSDDTGRTWRRTNPVNERASYYSQIRVDPKDSELVYALFVRTWISTDGGTTFSQTEWAFSSYLTGNYIHGDFHAMWIDPTNSNHLIVGSDGGLYTSYDRGATWEAHPMPTGQFAAVAVDMRKPYFIYGGLQDNGSWAGPSATRHRSGITDSDWFKLGGADGAYVSVDPTDNATVYTESQYANISRLDLKTGRRKAIRPSAPEGEPPVRFNFITPFIMSPHDSRTLYIGAQRLYRTTNRADTWTPISPDLTKGRPSPETGEGATITAIAESPMTQGVLYVGTDDGNLQVSRDGGKTWVNVADRVPGLPKDSAGRSKSWVNRLEASHFDAGTVYASFDAHRDDDFAVYLYRTRDFGERWESIGTNLPEGSPVRVIREDPKNPNLLFAGTERGAWVSVDGGRRWLPLMNALPTVRVDDMVIHPRDAELVAGTHGRSVYVMDISPLQQLTSAVLSSPVHLFDPKPVTLLDIDVTRNRGASGARPVSAPNPYSALASDSDTSGAAPSGATIDYWLSMGTDQRVRVVIRDAEGHTVRELTGSSDPGLNCAAWDLRQASLAPLPSWRRVGSNDSVHLSRETSRPGRLVEPGDYRVRLEIGAMVEERVLRVEPDRSEK